MSVCRDGEELDSQGDASSQPDTISIASRTSQNTLDSDKVGGLNMSLSSLHSVWSLSVTGPYLIPSHSHCQNLRTPYMQLQATRVKLLPANVYVINGPSDGAVLERVCVCEKERESLLSVNSRPRLYLVIAPQKACPPPLSVSNRKANTQKTHGHTYSRYRHFYVIVIISGTLNVRSL